MDAGGDEAEEAEIVRAWAEEPAVRSIFDELRRETLAVQREGLLGLPDFLSEDQIRVLEANLDRLSSGLGSGSLRDRADEILDGMRRGIEPEWTEHDWIMRGRDGRGDPAEARDACRAYPIAQALAMDAAAWSDPARAMLYTGLQHALHKAFEDSFDRDEPKITEKLLSKIEQTFEGRIFKPLQIRNLPIPGARSFDLGWASMQERSDMLAADLAIAIGLRVCGREMYRVVLLQAKNALEGGRFDVSLKGKSKQIDELLSTGMGWFAFYPDVKHWNPFLATVRPATDIFRDVFEDRDAPRYQGAFDVEGLGGTAWDLAVFVSLCMTTQDLGIGRLFPDVESAAEALSAQRKRPLAKRVLVADLTGALGAHKLVAALEREGFIDGRAISAPNRRHRPRPKDAPTPRGPGKRR